MEKSKKKPSNKTTVKPSKTVKKVNSSKAVTSTKVVNKSKSGQKVKDTTIVKTLNENVDTNKETVKKIETEVKKVDEVKPIAKTTPTPKKSLSLPKGTPEEITSKVSTEVAKTIKKQIESKGNVNTGEPKEKHKKLLFYSAILSILVTIAFIFVPFSTKIKPLDFINFKFSAITTNGLIAFLIFIILLITCVIDIYLLLNALIHYKSKQYVKNVCGIVSNNFVISIIYGAGGIAYFITNTLTKNNDLSFSLLFTAIQTLIVVFNAVVKSYFVRDYIFIEKKHNETFDDPIFTKVKAFKRPFPSIESLIYVIIFTGLSIGVLFIDLFSVKTKSGEIISVSIRMLDLFLKTGQDLNEGFKMVGFLTFAFLISIGVLLVTCILLFFAKRQNFYKVCGISIAINLTLVLFISLYGLYYKIVMFTTVDKINELLGPFLPGKIQEDIKNIVVDTSSYYMAIVGVSLLIIVLVRNPARHALLYEELEEKSLMDKRLKAPEVTTDSIKDLINDYDLLNLNDKESEGGVNAEGPVDVNILEDENIDLAPFDACPVFTELDAKANSYKLDLEHREKFNFDNATLPSLVKFIVNYAKNSRLHLSYSKEDIAAFVAGLGATRLTILQGMSGTGKTSLPKIFMEAIYGNCELIEIESSWREKNELLGFYNEFSKIYTPKKFIQRLYKASMNPEIITFIVLDEMNLSRIEYYFSDFLSLMENEEANRKVKLTNIKIFNIKDHKKVHYSQLEEDHTLKVPTNVWFIGTANRDESTFEISDKVYDRAHTMNFNKRAPAITQFDSPMKPKFLKYESLNKLFEDAKKSYKFDIESNEIIKRVEQLLIPFNISFGNRIYKQINEFVRIYCSCFDNPAQNEFDAVETILLTKVVMKLENKSIDNKDMLIHEFERLKLKRCSEFISKLSED